MDKSKVRKALEDTPEPTPGYLYNEFAQWTFKDVGTQTELVNYLFDRLQRSHTSVFVLYKALHIIKLLCELAHPDFQREVQRTPRAEVIRQLTTYRGMQDPKFGDAWNEKARQEAREALAVIFTDFSSQQKRLQPPLQATDAVEKWKSNGFGSTTDTAGPDTRRQGGFYTGLAAGTSDSTSGGVGGVRSYAAMGGHIGEMPKENKWAEHMARMQNDPEYVRRGGLRGEDGSGASSKSFLGQLSRTAKASWSAVVQHEALRMQTNVPAASQTGGAGVESRYGRQMSTVDAAPGRQGRDNAFVPVQIGFDGAEDGRRAGSASSGFDAAEASRAASGGPWRPSIEPSSAERDTTTTTAHHHTAAAVSGFAFINHAAASQASLASATSHLTSTTPTRAAVQALTHTHMVTPQTTPQRVELTLFVAEAVKAVVTVSAQDASACGDVPSSSHTSSSASAAVSRRERTVWAALAVSMGAHLDPTAQPWRVRLNVLACLEALLKTSPTAVSTVLETALMADGEAGGGAVAGLPSSAPLSSARVATVLTQGQAVLRAYFSDENGEAVETDDATHDGIRVGGQNVTAVNLVRDCASAVQATLKEKAVKVLGLLGVSLTRPQRVRPAVPAAAAPRPDESTAPVPSSPGALDDLFTTSSPMTTARASAGGAGAGGGLFDDVQLTQRRPVRATSTTSTGATVALALPSSSEQRSSHAVSGFLDQEMTQEGSQVDRASSTSSSQPRIRILSKTALAPLPQRDADAAVDTTGASHRAAEPIEEDGAGLARPRRVPLSLDQWEQRDQSVLGAAKPASDPLQDLFSGPTTSSVSEHAPTTTPPAADLNSLRAAQRTLEALLSSLQQRQGQGGADAPTADEFARAQDLLQQQRLLLRQQQQSSLTHTQPGMTTTTTTTTAAPTSTARGGQNTQNDFDTLLFGEPHRGAAIWERPDTSTTNTAPTTADVLLTDASPRTATTHALFQVGGASKPTSAQIADTHFAAVQAEMFNKYVP